MSATARALDPQPSDPADELAAVEAAHLDALQADSDTSATEYATRGARRHRLSRPHLRTVAPLRTDRASRGVFALVVGGLLIAGMVVILVINTTIAQSAFTVSELQAQQAVLTQQEQQLSRQIADAAAPDALEQKARAMGMVPSESPVFLNPDGSIVGNPKPARGATSTTPVLSTPADATAGEAVDAGSGDLPAGLPADYDPAAADAAQVQARDYNQPRVSGPRVTAAQRAASTPVSLGAGTLDAVPVDPLSAEATAADAAAAKGSTTKGSTTKGSTPATTAGAKAAKPKTNQWSDTIDVTGLTTDGLTAAPAR